MKRRHWLFLVFSIFLSAVVGVISWGPSRSAVLGLLHGEAFFQFRPTRYWREVLRGQGVTGQISEETRAQFRSYQSFSVLLECLRDPDPNVRWPAAALLRHVGFARESVPHLQAALKDDDSRVRWHAVIAILRHGANAQVARDDLVTLMKSDPDDDIRHYAEFALWEVHPPTAKSARGWRLFSNREWGFAAEFPADPTPSEKQIDTPAGVVTAHVFRASVGPMIFQVVVADYPQEFIDNIPLEQRWEGARVSIPAFFPNGKLIRDTPIEAGNLSGREFLVESKPLGIMRSRHFWVGRRQYNLQLAYHSQFLIPKAGEHFMESYRIPAPSK